MKRRTCVRNAQAGGNPLQGTQRNMLILCLVYVRDAFGWYTSVVACTGPITCGSPDYGHTHPEGGRASQRNRGRPPPSRGGETGRVQDMISYRWGLSPLRYCPQQPSTIVFLRPCARTSFARLLTTILHSALDIAKPTTLYELLMCKFPNSNGSNFSLTNFTVVMLHETFCFSDRHVVSDFIIWEPMWCASCQLQIPHGLPTPQGICCHQTASCTSPRSRASLSQKPSMLLETVLAGPLPAQKPL